MPAGAIAAGCSIVVAHPASRCARAAARLADRQAAAHRLGDRAVLDDRHYALLALGLNVVVGYAGLLDLGYVGFFAIGAYSVALLTGRPAQALAVALAAVPVGHRLVGDGPACSWAAPTLRLRGDYLAIVTLGVRRDHPHRGATAPRALKAGRHPGFTFLPAPAGVKYPDGTQIFGVIDGKPYYWLASRGL